MKPFQSSFTVPSYFLYLAITVYAVQQNFMSVPLKMNHVEYLVIASVCFFLFIILSLKEVHGSSSITRNEKLMWTIGLLFMTLIAGTVYLISGRKRVLQNAHIVNREKEY